MSAQPPAAPGGEGREQDRLLPVANIQRMACPCCSADEKIAEGRQGSPRRASPSSLLVTEEAAGRCAEEKRKTINGDDLIFALQNLGFERVRGPAAAVASRSTAACRNRKRKASITPALTYRARLRSRFRAKSRCARAAAASCGATCGTSTIGGGGFTSSSSTLASLSATAS